MQYKVHTNAHPRLLRKLPDISILMAVGYRLSIAWQPVPLKSRYTSNSTSLVAVYVYLDQKSQRR